MVALFSTYCCVNSCNNLCSVCKLLSYLVNILTRDESMIALFSTYYCMNSCFNLCSACKLLSYLDNILTQDVWFKHIWLLFSPLTAVWTHAFTCMYSGCKLLSYLVYILSQDLWLKWIIALFSTYCWIN